MARTAIALGLARPGVLISDATPHTNAPWASDGSHGKSGAANFAPVVAHTTDASGLRVTFAWQGGLWKISGLTQGSVAQ